MRPGWLAGFDAHGVGEDFWLSFGSEQTLLSLQGTGYVNGGGVNTVRTYLMLGQPCKTERACYESTASLVEGDWLQLTGVHLL